jgi:hypothetical protein
MGEVLPPVQTFREDHPEQPKAGNKPWSWLFLRRDVVLTGSKPALCGQESGGPNGLGTENALQKDQGIADHFARTGHHAIHAYQQTPYGIHLEKIVELGACGRFT